jgi:hypothetical protein
MKKILSIAILLNCGISFAQNSNGIKLKKGQTIYIKAYGESLIGNDYDDPNSRKRVFPNLNPTTVNAISFVMQ